ncbi:MAG: hypothetical protein J0M29_12705 [Chitinophagales bacterium]|nr:hypothetical protein [Chitinophagales bacterium]
MNKFYVWAAALFSAVLIIPACKDGRDEGITGFGSVEIEFDNRAEGESLVFGKTYTNAAGESLSFSLLDYYVSNVVLVSEDGARYVAPKDSCYFLCKHEDPDSRVVRINNVPAGNYSGLEFMIGVDSAKSVSPVTERVGVLDPATGASGHYWSWNAGYIFMKVEGNSPAAGTADNFFQYHIGLFGGFNSPTLNNLKTIALTAPAEPAMVRQGEEAPHFHLYVDALEIFKSPNVLSIEDYPAVHASPYSANIAANYADMFVIDHVHNH